jgi:hypothetical protein
LDPATEIARLDPARAIPLHVDRSQEPIPYDRSVAAGRPEAVNSRNNALTGATTAPVASTSSYGSDSPSKRTDQLAHYRHHQTYDIPFQDHAGKLATPV